MVADIASYQPGAVSFGLLTLFSEVSGTLLKALVSASASSVRAGPDALPPVTLLKFASSAWLAEASNSAWSAACCCWACSSAARLAGLSAGGVEPSATSRTPRWTDIWFDTRSSAPRAFWLPLRSASLVPLPTEALNVSAA